MSDALITIGRSQVQHGPLNDRVYLMSLDPEDTPGIVDRIEELAEKNSYSKIFAKTPESAARQFRERGYVREAVVPNFFENREGLVFLSRFLSKERGMKENEGSIKKVLALAEEKRNSPAVKNQGLTVREMEESDAEVMADLYRSVFESYPFPIFDPKYIRKTMRTHIRYFAVEEDGTLAGLASAEMDREHGASEMTDFATSPCFRGRGLAGAILAHMEEVLRRDGVDTFYTIARAESAGMNIVFSRAGYEFGGTLINNTNIGGRLESMNVWYRP